MSRYFDIDYEFSPQAALARIEERIASGQAGYICVADGNILSRVHSDPAYRDTVAGAMFSICDSSWVPMYVRLLHGFRPEQYCGSQIFEDITGSGRWRMMFVGSSQEVLDALRARLVSVDGRIAEMPFLALPYCRVEEFDYEGIAAQINGQNPDIIWLSLGAPKQEQFAQRLTPLLRRGVVIPVGAVFDFRAGLGIRRAPQWMIRWHLEWLYRIFLEPRKQFRRVAGILSQTPKILFDEWKHTRSSSNS